MNTIQTSAEIEQLRASLAEKESEITELKAIYDDAFKPCENGHGMQAECYGCQRDRALSELATAQKQIEELKDAYRDSRNAGKLIEDKLSAERDSLRSQLQTAMEERDSWKSLAEKIEADVRLANERVEAKQKAYEHAAEVANARGRKIGELETLCLTKDNKLDQANSRLEETEKAAGLMFETVDAHRNPDALQECADLLIKRGWTPILFTPEGAPEGFIAKITHPYQKWHKLHHMNKITEQALKIELREDTDNLHALLSRLSASRETERKTDEH